MQLISGRLLIRNISDRCSQAATSKLADIYVSVSRSRRQKCFLQGDSEVAALNPPSFGRIGKDCCLVWNMTTSVSWPEDTRTMFEPGWSTGEAVPFRRGMDIFQEGMAINATPLNIPPPLLSGVTPERQVRRLDTAISSI